jgi:hypothetical protein
MMRVKPAIFSFVLMALLAIPAKAEELSVKLINSTDQAIASVTATPKGAAEPSTANVLSSAVAPSETGAMTIPRQEGECLFDLNITFASGATASRPDLDLCQADGVVME